jgi:Fuc2NAc and GlcNAc transferase
MVALTAIGFLALGFVSALLLEYLIEWTSRRMRWFALPNERSFHAEPTPSIGGLAIVIPVLAYLGYVSAAGVAAAQGLLLGAGLLAVVGLRDDLKELSSAFRFACQILAVALVLWYLALPWPWLALLVTGVALLWHVNLFNFMDGIDGIAGSQCLIYCLGVLLLAGDLAGWLGELNWLLAGASIGFLVFNWPPARIFMGDVGSGFLGLLLAVIAVEVARQEYLPLVASLILLAGFWFDASYTLCVRMISGQKFVQAHRSHLYQHLAAKKGHRWTTLVYAAFAVVWLLPLAAFSANFPQLNVAWLALSISPMAVAAWYFQAGRPQHRETPSPLA